MKHSLQNLALALLFSLFVAVFCAGLGLLSASHAAPPRAYPTPSPAFDPRCPSHYTQWGVCTNALTPTPQP